MNSPSLSLTLHEAARAAARRRDQRGRTDRKRAGAHLCPGQHDQGVPGADARSGAGGGAARRTNSCAAAPRTGTADQLPPLLGIPMAIKDVITVEGVPLTCGSRILEGYIPPYQATVVDRLVAAGAVILGKTNTDEFAMGSSTENSAYFTTRNPWDTDPGAGRIERGQRSGSRSGSMPRRARLGHGRERAPAGQPLRHRRVEADLRPGEPLRARRVRLVAGPDRALDEGRHGRCPAASGDRGT